MSKQLSNSVHIVAAELETPLFSNNASFWEGVFNQVPHYAAQHQNCLQKDSEIKFLPRKFDCRTLGIPTRDNEKSEVQHLMALEIVDRMIGRLEILKKNDLGLAVGVFVAQSENGQVQTQNSLDGLFAIGSSRAIAPARISHHFGWTGPSMSLDTACSSSLTALHIAAQSIKEGLCDAAVVVGVSHFSTWEIGSALHGAQLLSPNGKLSALGASRDGYVRSEGASCVLLVNNDTLQRLQLSSYLEILATSLNQNSREKHFIVPNASSQHALYRLALKKARISANDVDYVELHATGTSAGDKIEIEGLVDAFSERDSNYPLLLGALKSNVGHLEAVAGLASVSKIVLAMAGGTIPGTVMPEGGFLPIESHSNLKILSNNKLLKSGQTTVIGVSSFGFSGANGFLLAKGTSQGHTSPRQSYPSEFSFPMLKRGMSASFCRDLQMIGERETPSNSLQLLRVGSQIRTKAELGFATFHDNSLVCEGKALKSPVFCFGGQYRPNNSSHIELFKAYPTYETSIKEIAGLFSEFGYRDLIFDYFQSDRSVGVDYSNQLFSFAHHYALSKILTEFGLVPEAYIGYSAGEIAAYACGGGLSLETAAQVMVARTNAMSANDPHKTSGGMLEVSGQEETINELLKEALIKTLIYSNNSHILQKNNSNNFQWSIFDHFADLRVAVLLFFTVFIVFYCFS